jgi:hypothetical protein
MGMAQSNSPRSTLLTEGRQSKLENGQHSRDEGCQLPSNVVWVSSDRHLALTVKFLDATLGRAVFEPSALKGAFSKLEDPVYFSRFVLERGSIVWPDGQALTFDGLYWSIQQTGVYVVR